MILIDLPGRIVCDEEGCEAKGPVQLSLTAAGGFAFRLASKQKWQVATAKNGTFVCLCEKHVKTVQMAPAIPSLVRSPH